MIGWRGSPGTKDEPQHLIKGGITTKLLKLLDIKYCVLKNENDFLKLKNLINFSKKNKSIVACLIKKNSLTSKKKNNLNSGIKSSILREDFLKILLENVNSKTNLIATTGYTSRELHQIRLKYSLKKGSDFYVVGGMGHSSMVALGTSLYTNKQVICLDGDGSIMMHMGSLANIGNFARSNYKHVLLNNYSHESVGGQKTFSEKLNFEQLTKSVGYKKYFSLKKKKYMSKIIKKFLVSRGPCLLEVAIKRGSMKDLLRPRNLIKVKKKFMNK